MGAVLVTGAAGFIGFHVARRYLDDGVEVVGLDDLNDYYDPALKRARLAELSGRPGFTFEQADVADAARLDALFAAHAFGTVIHLAAQAGVRHSLERPFLYGHSNLSGFLSILEACRHRGVGHLVYASSSSVYGESAAVPFSTEARTDHPVSLYGATKKANELFAHSYSHLFGIPTTGLRFFTVYGPWGRPDMALFLFTKAMLAGEPVPLFNEGEVARDFTYIDDVVECVVRIAARPATPDDHSGDAGAATFAPYRLHNIGNDRPVTVTRLIEILERCLGRTARKRLLPMQPGDVRTTCAEIGALRAAIGFAPSTPLEEGVERFVAWYRGYHGR